MRLAEVLDRVNLPDLIMRECGADAAHGLNRERGGVIRDPRPGHFEMRPSFSVYRRQGGRWYWKRHDGSDGQRGSAYDFLLALGHSEIQAREELERLGGVAAGWTLNSLPRVTRTPPSPLYLAYHALNRCTPLDAKALRNVARIMRPLIDGEPATQDLQARGLLGWEGLQVGALLDVYQTHEKKVLAPAGAVCFPLPGPDGKPWGLKIRNLGSAEDLAASGLNRYVYRIAGHGAPAWCSPAYGQGTALVVTEGELNGAAASRALLAAGLALDVQGLAGAGGVPHLDGIPGRVVYLYFDADEAGNMGRDRVALLAQAAGAAEVRVLPVSQSGDFCDLLGVLGAAAFSKHLEELLKTADLWQSKICGKTELPQIKDALSEGKPELWQCDNTVQEWGASDGKWAVPDDAWRSASEEW